MDKISKERSRELNDFCKKLNISFNDFSLLQNAFCHRSITNEQKNIINNERLEFLGDSVLGMITASYLYRNVENKEGDLSKIKSAVVSEKALAPVARQIGIPKLLVLSHGEEITGGRNKDAILADCMEAIIGAYYLDAGYKSVEKYVLNFIIPSVKKVITEGIGTKDYKSVLQEMYQKLKKQIPQYKLISKEGPEHNQIFNVEVYLGDKKFGPASAHSKKEAEQAAAKLAIEYLNRN